MPCHKLSEGSSHVRQRLDPLPCPAQAVHLGERGSGLLQSAWLMTISYVFQCVTPISVCHLLPKETMPAWRSHQCPEADQRGRSGRSQVRGTRGPSAGSPTDGCAHLLWENLIPREENTYFLSPAMILRRSLLHPGQSVPGAQGQFCLKKRRQHERQRCMEIPAAPLASWGEDQ